MFPKGDTSKIPGGVCDGGSSKTAHRIRKEKTECVESFCCSWVQYQALVFVQTAFLSPVNNLTKKKKKKDWYSKAQSSSISTGKLKKKKKSIALGSLKKPSMAFWGCLTMGQIWRSSAITLHGPEQKLKSMWSLLCKSWDLTGLLRVESRSLFLLPRHGMIEVPLFEKGTEFGNFPIHSVKK